MRWDERPADNPMPRTRCPWCRKSRPVHPNGRLRKHPRWMEDQSKEAPGPCKGSGKRPEEFDQ